MLTGNQAQARVAGYFSLTVGQTDALDVPERIRKGMCSYPIPVVILARLAVSLQHQGQGIGIGMLQDAIRRTATVADQAGVRALLTHPIDDDDARFLPAIRRRALPIREQQSLLLLKDARGLLRSLIERPFEHVDPSAGRSGCNPAPVRSESLRNANPQPHLAAKRRGVSPIGLADYRQLRTVDRQGPQLQSVLVGANQFRAHSLDVPQPPCATCWSTKTRKVSGKEMFMVPVAVAPEVG